MSWYLVLDGTRVLSMTERSVPPAAGAYVELDARPTSPPKTGSELHWINNMLQWIDTRTLAHAKQQKADELRAAATDELMSYFDEIGELLAMLANNVTPPAAYRNKIAAYRTKVVDKRAALTAAATIAAVDAIVW